MAIAKTAMNKPASKLTDRKMGLLTVPTGPGEKLGKDGSGTNKAAKALDAKGVGKDETKKKMVRNNASDSPVGQKRPTQDGGPRKGQGSVPKDKKGINKFDLFAGAR
jgi:hypothetical protein